MLSSFSDTAHFFDGQSASGAPVRVSVADHHLYLYDPYEGHPVQAFMLSGLTHNQIGGTFFLYLDNEGLQYLQMDGAHPLVPVLISQADAGKTTWAGRLMRQPIALLAPLLLLLAAGLYLLLLGLVPFLGLQMIGRDAEVSLGNRLHEVMLKEMGLFSSNLDTSGTAHLQAFANSMRLSKQYHIRVTLVHSDIVNAYALPGGQVVVYCGLLKKLRSAGELAALLAHESTHVNERHSLRTLLRSSANGLLVSILFGDATGISGALAGNVENLSGLRYSRQLEAEADALGMDLLRNNGIPPQGMEQLMQTLRKEGDMPGMLSILSSHPLTSERIAAAAAYCRRYPHAKAYRMNAEMKALFDILKKTTR